MPDITATRPAADAPIETAWGQQVHDLVEGLQTGGPISCATNGTQWSPAWTVVVFPRAYTAAPRVFVVNQSGSAVIGCFVRNVTTTQFEIGVTRMDTNAAATGSICWFAIGTPA